MEAIGKRNFNYCYECRNIAAYQSREGAGSINTTHEDKQNTTRGYPWRTRPCRTLALLSRPIQCRYPPRFRERRDAHRNRGLGLSD